jgi:pyridoxal phosphate enzyme (YggS family)
MIGQNIKQLLNELPEEVQLVAAAKTRHPAEILEAVEAGVTIIGENYIQEAEIAYGVAGNRVKWHFIGHLQKNKVKRAVRLFDMIETVDSVAIAGEIDKRCAQIDKLMLVLIEVNRQLVRDIAAMPRIRVMGLMTMGPDLGDPEDSRPYFVETRKTFERIKSLDLSNIEMKYLSMGMTNSYRIAIEEGANMVRLGSRIFGERD